MFSILSQGFSGFGRKRKSLLSSDDPCSFSQKQGLEGQGKNLLIILPLCIGCFPEGFLRGNRQTRGNGPLRLENCSFLETHLRTPALKTDNFRKALVASVKRKNGITKALFALFFLRCLSRGWCSQQIVLFGEVVVVGFCDFLLMISAISYNADSRPLRCKAAHP